MPSKHSQFTFAAGAAFCAILLAAGAFAGPFAQEQGKVNSPSASSESQAVTERSQFYCNLNALSSAERARHKQLSEQLALAQRQTKELPDGYAFQLQRGAVSLADLAEWVSLESKCCPFFNFGIEMERNSGPLWLELRGEEGVKQFIVSDFHLRQRAGD